MPHNKDIKHNATQETESQTPQPPKKKRRRWLRILIILLVLSQVIQLTFYFFATPILRNTIQKKIHKQSEGLYSIDFERISIDIGMRAISLENFRLNPDSTLYRRMVEQGKTNKGLYEIRFDELKLEEIDVYALLRFGRLNIGELQLEKPLVWLIGKPPSAKQKSYDAIHRDLYPAISNFVKSLKISKISINQGVFDFYKHEKKIKESTAAKSFSAVLYNFYLDEDEYKRRENVFYALNFEIEIHDYVFFLKDRIHKVKAEKISLSSFDSQISVENIELSPKGGTTKAPGGLLMQIDVPSFEIKNLNFEQVYFEKILDIENIIIEKPRISLRAVPREKARKKRQDKSFSLYDVVGEHIGSTKIGNLGLKNAEICFFENFQAQKPLYSADSVQLNLSNFLLDSLSWQREEKIFYSDNIDLSMKNFDMLLKDKSHRLQAGHVGIFSSQSQIFAQNLRLSPKFSGTYATRHGIRLYKVFVPHFELTQIDLHKAFNQGKVPLQSVQIRSPQISVFSYTDSTQNRQKKVAKKDFIHLLARHLSFLSIGRIYLQNGKIELNTIKNGEKTAFSEGKIEAQMSRFRLLPQRKEEKFDFGEIQLRITDYQMQRQNNMHRFRLEELSLSSESQKILLRGIHLLPDTGENALHALRQAQKNSYVEFSIEKLALQNADIRQALFGRELKISEIVLDTPSVRLVHYKGLPNVKSLPRPARDSLKITVNQVLNILPRDTVQMLPDSVPALTADSLAKLSPDSILSLQDSAFISEFDSLIAITADTLSTLDSLTSYIKTTEVKDLYDFLGTYLDLLEVNRLSIKNGNFSFVQNDSMGQKLASSENNILLNLNNFRIQPDSLENNPNLLFSDDIEILLNDYVLELPGSIYQVKAREIGFSTLRSELFAKTLRVLPKKGLPDSLKSNRFLNVYVPDFRISGIDVRQIRLEKAINLDTIALQKPFFILVENQDSLQSAKPASAGQEIKISLPPGFQRISAKKFEIENGRVALSHERADSSFFSFKSELSLNLENFALDSGLWQAQQRIFDFDELNIKLSHLDQQFPDEIHRLKLDFLELSTREQYIGGSGVWFGHDSSATATEKQEIHKKNMLFEARVPEFFIFGFDFDKLYEKKQLEAGIFHIEQPDISLLRLAAEAESEPNEPNSEKNPPDLYPLIEKFLDKVEISEISLNKGQFRFNTPDSATQFYISDFSAAAKNFLLDSTAQQNRDKFLYSDNLNVKVRNFSHSISQLYDLRSKEVGLVSSESRVYIDSFSLEPQMSKAEFTETLEYQRGFLDVYSEKIELERLDLNRLLARREIALNHILVDSLRIYVFKDRRLPYDTTRRPPMPVGFLKNLPFYVNIDSIQAESLRVVYEEYGEESKKTGKIYLQLDALLQNVTNDSALIAQDTKMTLNAEGTFMDTGKVVAEIIFPLNATNEEHTYELELSEMNMERLNELTRHSFYAVIKEGEAKKLKFKAKADNDVAEGKMHFRYNDLKVAILDKDGDDPEHDEKAFLTLAVNGLIRNDNPKNRAFFPRSGEMYTVRDPSRVIFRLWVQSIISGIQSTMGFSSKDMKNREKQEEVADKERRKAEREYRREFRKEQREIKRRERFRSKRKRQNARARKREKRQQEKQAEEPN